MLQDLLALLRDERDRALEMLRLIEEEGLSHYEAHGDGPLRDVTAKRANRQRQIIERMDRLIALFEARACSPTRRRKARPPHPLEPASRRYAETAHG